MSTRWARFARGWIAAVFSTLIAAASHSLANGAAPSILALALSLAFAGMICVGLTGKRLSNWRLGGSVAASQLIFHGLFASLGGGIPLASTGTGHLHHLTLTAAAGTPAVAAGWHAGGWMIAAHIAAGIVTFLILRYGEAAFWRLRDIAGVVFGSLRLEFSRVPIPRASRGAVPTGLASLPKNLAVLAVTRYRGPPLLQQYL